MAIEFVSVVSGPATVLGVLLNFAGDVDFNTIIPMPPFLNKEPFVEMKEEWIAGHWGTSNAKKSEHLTLIEADGSETMVLRFRTDFPASTLLLALAALFPREVFKAHSVCTSDDAILARAKFHGPRLSSYVADIPQLSLETREGSLATVAHLCLDVYP